MDTNTPAIPNSLDPALFDKLDQVGMATLVAMLQTKTATAAAEALSIDRSTLYIRIKKYGLDKIFETFPKHALIRLQLHSVQAADNLAAKMDSKNDNVSLQASTEILDRVGLAGKPEVVQNNETKVLVMPGELGERYGVSSNTVSSSEGQDKVSGS